MGLEQWALDLAASPWIYLVMYLFATIDGFFPPIPSESVVIRITGRSSSVPRAIALAQIRWRTPVDSDFRARNPFSRTG